MERLVRRQNTRIAAIAVGAVMEYWYGRVFQCAPILPIVPDAITKPSNSVNDHFVSARFPQYVLTAGLCSFGLLVFYWSM